MITSRWFRTLALLSAAAGVAAAQTVFTMTTSNSTITYGQTVTFRVTYGFADPPAFTPFTDAGITFYDGAVGGIVVGSARTDSSGVATLQVSHLTPGVHTIIAFTPVIEGTPETTQVTQTVNRATPQITLVSSLNPSDACHPVTFTASVTGVSGVTGPTGSTGTLGLSGLPGYTGPIGAPAPTGTVAFSLDGAPLSSVSLTAGAQPLTATASLTLDFSSLSTGSHSVRGVYNGDTIYATNLASVTQVENPAATTTSLASSINPADLNQPVTLTATVLTCFQGTAGGTVTFLDSGQSLGPPVSVSGGHASLNVSFTTSGQHSLQAQYSGDAFNAPSAGALVETVRAPTTVTLNSAPNPSVIAQSVVLTATVQAPGGGIPAGNVAFFDNTTQLGSAGVDQAGNAAITVSFQTVGTHPLTATFTSTSTAFGGGTSAVHNQQVNKIPTTTTLALAPNPSLAAQTVTLTATVAPSVTTDLTLTGTVTFTDGSTVLGTASVSAGVATLQVPNGNQPALAVGTHAITATYSGDSNFAGSQDTKNQVVNLIPSTTSIAPAVTTITLGGSVTLTATVTLTSLQTPVTPTGTVTFSVNGQAQTPAVPLNNGSASFTLSNLAASATPYSVTAAYSGDTNVAASTSSAASVTVNKAATTTVLTSAPNPSLAGQTFVLTAAVSTSATTARPITGTVTFTEGATVLGTASVNGGVATLSIPSLAVGSHSLTATYGGDNNFTGSAGGTTQVINPIATTTTLTMAPNPSFAGQAIVLTATISPGVATALAITGTVTFSEGATVLGTATVSSGVAALSVPPLAVGSHNLTATYSGEVNFSGSAGNATQVVNPIPTTTTLTPAPNPSTYSQTIVLTARVAPTLTTSLTVSGSVTFADGGTVLGTATVSNGTATLQLPASAGQAFLTVGTHTITATYGGDANFSGSSDSKSQVVNPIQSTTAVTPAASTIAFGQSVTLTATVTLVNPPTAVTPTGTVTFLVNGQPQTPAVALNNAKASITISNLPASATAYAVTAIYSGDANVAGSAATAATVTVNRAVTTTSLAPSSPTVYQGQPVTLTATVSSATASAALATGTVTFFDGGGALGSAPLVNGTAKTTFTPSVGQHSFTASFGGDSNFAGSTSTAISVISYNPATTITASANPAQPVYGQTVILSAIVTPPAATGTVTFQEGATVLGTAPSGSATVSVSNLTVGTHTITVNYSGDATYSSSSATITVTVSKAPTTTSLSAAPTSATPDQKITLTVKVGPSTATGAVTFLDGSTSLGTANLSAGSASLTVSFPGSGTHTITASYAGDNNYAASTSNAVTVTVGLPGTTTTLTAAPSTAELGQDVVLTASVSPAGATGTVTFSEGSNSQTATLTNGRASATFSNLTLGSHSFVAHYGGDTKFAASDSSAVTVTVNKGTTQTSVSATPNPSTVGQTVTVTATVKPAFGAVPVTGSVIFSVDGAAGQPATLANGAASFSIATLAEGSHSFSAAYGGDSNYQGSTSASITQTVNKAQTVLTISAPASLPNGTVGTAYPQQTFTATGGTAPLTWSLVASSTTTNDLKISAAGVLTGTPTTQGNFQVTVQVQDSSSPPLTGSKTFPVSFAFPPLPTITVTATQVTVPGYPLALKGTLQLTFAPNAAGLPANFQNPQLVFAQNGQATIQIDIPANSTAPIAIPTFQQGSVAGTITVSLTGATNAATGQAVTPFPSPAPLATVTVGRSVPTIVANSLTLTGGASGLQVAFNAISTPRDLTKVDLSFTPAAGSQLTGTTVSIDLASTASQWFSSTQGVQNGGSFSVVIPISFSGDPKAIPTAVSVTLTNSVGPSTAASATKQ